MAEPELYVWYSAEEAISLFGSPAEAQRLCDGQWLIFDNTAICLTDIGEKSGASHFHNGSSFYWVAKRAYRVSDGRFLRPLPNETWECAEIDRKSFLKRSQRNGMRR